MIIVSASSAFLSDTKKTERKFPTGRIILLYTMTEVAVLNIYYIAVRITGGNRGMG